METIVLATLVAGAVMAVSAALLFGGWYLFFKEPTPPPPPPTIVRLAPADFLSRMREETAEQVVVLVFGLTTDHVRKVFRFRSTVAENTSYETGWPRRNSESYDPRADDALHTLYRKAEWMDYCGQWCEWCGTCINTRETCGLVQDPLEIIGPAPGT